MYLLSISENILLFISAFGILQAILLGSLIYFHPKTDRSVSTYLALYVFCWCIPMFLPFVLHFSTWQNGIFLEAFPFLLGPLLYLYIRSFKETINWSKAWPHFILFLIFFLADWIIYMSIRGKYPSSHEIPAELISNPMVRVRIGIRVAQMVVYYILARRTLVSYQKSIHHLFSETSRINLSWGNWLINGYLFLVVAIIAVYFLVVQYPEDFNLIILLNVALVTPYIYGITFKGITQFTLWQMHPDSNRKTLEDQLQQAEKFDNDVNKAKKITTSNTGAVNDKMDQLVKRITVLMENEKLYQETELTLQQLAGRLEIPVHQASQVINEGMNKNFYELINEYRVREAKSLLSNPNKQNFTILSVGFEAGFNSKTTFNTVFKKFTGLTPSEYRENHKQTIPAG